MTPNDNQVDRMYRRRDGWAWICDTVPLEYWEAAVVT